MYVASSSAISGGTDGTIAFTLVASTGTATSSATNATANVINGRYDPTAPTTTSITIASNNANHPATLAKSGDLVTVSFSTDEGITAPSVTIGSHTVTATSATNATNAAWNATQSWSASATMGAGDSAYDGSTLPFSIAAPVDYAGNASSTAATWVTSGSTITLDLTAPVITLTGSNATVNQYATYTDAGATATDSREGSLTSSIVTNNPVNTAVPGTYTVTYNVSDAAGNAATQVSRTVIVLSSGGGGVVCTGCTGLPSPAFTGVVLTGSPAGSTQTPSTSSGTASTLTSTQIQSILSLLQSFGADQGTINNVSAALNGQPTSGTGTMTSGSCSTPFTASLKLGSTGSQVLALQQFLNKDPDTMVASTGPGSPGMETSTYGPLTAAAVSKFQQKYAAQILTPAGLTTPTGYFGPASIKEANALCSS